MKHRELIAHLARFRRKLATRNANVRRYYPDVLSNAKEMQILADVIEPELDFIIVALKGCALDTFVYGANKNGLERWEKMLNITPRTGADVRERRRGILVKINASLPYTERQLQKLIDATFGSSNATVSIDHLKYVVWLDLAVHAHIDTKALARYARLVIPANMEVKLRMAQKTSSIIYTGGVVTEYSEQKIGG